MDITGISKSKAGLGLQFEVASKDRLQVGQRFFMRPKRSWWFLFVLLCVFVVFICFFSRKDGFGEMTMKYCIILKKDIYIYTNFKGCQVDGKGCHSRLQTSPLFGGSSLTPALPQGYTMSLGMKKTKAQYALPHPYLGAYVIMCCVIR